MTCPEANLSTHHKQVDKSTRRETVEPVRKIKQPLVLSNSTPLGDKMYGQRLEGIPVECRLAFRGGTVITALESHMTCPEANLSTHH